LVHCYDAEMLGGVMIVGIISIGSK